MHVKPKLAFHEMMGRLGIGDLHPGGVEASRFLVAELSKHGVKRVLEVGAGIGSTTERMMRSGLHVTPIEPNAVLAGILARRLGMHASPTPFDRFEGPAGAFDAVIAESVFYAFDLRTAFAKVRSLVRPGGLFGFAEMLWTPAAQPDVVAFIHDQTEEIFGIPMAPRTVVTTAGWAAALREAGFSEIAAARLTPAAPDAERHARRRRLALGLLAHPRLLPLFLDYRSHQRIRWAPEGWLENRVAVWRRN
jgi:SAM-dependent methyltransferase